MKSLYILGIVALLGLAMFLSMDAKTNDKYLQWKAKYGMVFSEEEDQYRQQVFAENLKIIENHNDPSYTVAINQFAGLSQEEFKQTHLNLKIGARSGKIHQSIQAITDIDWRTKGAVGPVKDQGQCGSCWAFSTTGNLEGVNFLFGSKSMTLFSEQQLVDCSQSYGDQGCNGGWMDYGFEYVQAKGIVTEAEYPYVAVDQKCAKDGGPFKVSTHTDIKAGDCNGLLTALMIEPVSVAVDAATWSYYSGGILKRCQQQLDHGVLLVGYNQEGGYYIVKNSWGASWGENGYIRLALQNTCGICNQASYASI